MEEEQPHMQWIQEMFGNMEKDRDVASVKRNIKGGLTLPLRKIERDEPVLH